MNYNGKKPANSNSSSSDDDDVRGDDDDDKNNNTFRYVYTVRGPTLVKTLRGNLWHSLYSKVSNDNYL